jgi:ABC-2 type transport system ATP-binding protein
MSAIESVELIKHYGETVAVDGLSLDVEQGEVFGFLGPNGAGKTTTVKMLLGLVRPTAGQASVLGQPPGEPAAMRRVGFLPEHFRFPAWLTAEGLLDSHGRLYGLTRDERTERIPALLQRVGLGERARSRIGEFSKGMSQRLGLAQALIGDPELVFLDEPTSGLDPLGRRLVRDIIRGLGERGVTVFLNSHLLGEVEATCHRVAIINRGRVVRMGSQLELAQGAVEVRLRAGGLDEETRAGLARWGHLSPGDANGALTLTVESEEVLPQVARWLVDLGVDLYELSPRRLSLEELFVRAVGDEQGREDA